MNDFPSDRISEMSYPTRVSFGVGALSRLPAHVERLKMKRPLVITDAGVVKAGLAGKVYDVLKGAGIAFEADKLNIRYGDLLVADQGVTVEVDPAAMAAYMAEPRLEVTANLGLGDGTARILTNDLTHAYIDENMGTS